MGNLGKPLNSPLIWTRKGPGNLCGVTGIMPRGVTANRATWWPLSQSTAFRVVRSCRCDGQFCAKKAPYLSVYSHVNSVWAVQCEGLLWRAYTLGSLTRELGEPCHPRTAILASVGGGLRYAELTVVSVRQCERLVR